MAARESRQPLTDEMISNEIASEAKHLMLCMLPALFLEGVLAVAVLLAAPLLIKLPVIVVTVCLFAVFGQLVWQYFIGIKRKFRVVEDTLVITKEYEFRGLKVSRRRRGIVPNYETSFQFKEHGRVVVPNDCGQLDYAHDGDEYFIVVVGDKKPKVIQFYNKALYTYKA